MLMIITNEENTWLLKTNYIFSWYGMAMRFPKVKFISSVVTMHVQDN